MLQQILFPGLAHQYQELLHRPWFSSFHQAGDCQLVETTLKTTYNDCKPPSTDITIFSELSAGFEPVLILAHADTTVAKEETVTMTAKVKFACGGLDRSSYNSKKRHQHK